MRRTSKYLGKTFGEWTCVYVGIATCQARKKMNGKGNAKRPGHCNYYYCFKRVTSDNVCEKMIRLTSSQAAKVYRGDATVEEYAVKKQIKHSDSFTKLVSYTFIK